MNLYRSQFEFDVASLDSIGEGKLGFVVESIRLQPAFMKGVWFG